MDPVERGARMAQLRKDVGKLQRQVAAEFDIDKAAVSEWETGKSSPDRRKLVRLDEMYEAGGEVLRLYDVSQRDDVLDRVVSLAREVERLAARIDEMQDSIASLRSSPRAQ